MLSRIATPTKTTGSGLYPWAPPVTVQHFSVMRFTQTATGNSNDDGYLLVMLADQAHIAGRRDQALTLLDAAYSAFDRTVMQEE